MKIAHVVDSMEMGGAETLVMQMCRLQREIGHAPSIYAIASLGPLGEQMRADGFSVRANVGKRLSDSSRNFTRLFKELRPDVVHLHNPTPTIYAAAPARLAGVPSVLSTRHSLLAPPHDVIAELKYAVAARFCDWSVGICDATVANLRKMRSVPARKIKRIYNGTTALKRIARELWPRKDGFTLVYVGRLEPVKNHTLLLHAFRDAQASMPNLRLWMVGDGSQRRTLESLSNELGLDRYVTFWGQQLDVAPFFSAADLFIMSSVSEGLPMSLLQAFSIGLPAIVTDVGGMAEVVRFANAGLTVPLEDSMEMRSAILRLATHEDERGTFASNAEKAFESQFTLESMVSGYLDLYRTTPRVRRTNAHRCF